MKSLVVLLLLVAAQAHAADPPLPMIEAQNHFRRGVELYEDADYSGAVVEFRRAYDLVPNHRVLYNLGRVSAQMHDYAAATRFYRQYLTDGGTQVPPARRQEVEDELRKLSARVGQLRVVVDTVGAAVTVDDVPIGLAPLAGTVPVNAGRRRVVATATGSAPEARVVEVAGEETVVVALSLHPAPRPRPPAPPVITAIAPPRPVVVARPAIRRTWPVVLSWSATALCGAGAAVAGVMALSASRDLRDLRESYPVSPADLQAAQRRTRNDARIADTLLVGTTLLAAISLYVSLGGSHETAISAGASGVRVSGHF